MDASARLARSVASSSRSLASRRATHRTFSTASHRVVATIAGAPVLINNLAHFYYDARPLEPPDPLGGGNGDLTGFRVWESAPHLIRHLESHASLVHNKTVIELGAGTGAVGLAAAALGASRVVLSDADSTATLCGENGQWQERGRLATLRENAELNGDRAASVSVEALRWGDDEHLTSLSSRWPGGFETIVGSDVLYSPRMYGALRHTIHTLAAPNAATLVFAFPVRHGDEHGFVQGLAPAFELVRAVEDEERRLRIVELVRRRAGSG